MSAEFWSEILNGRYLLQKLGVQVRTKFYSRHRQEISLPKRQHLPRSLPSTLCLSFPLEYKRLGRDINHSPSTRAGIKNEWRFTSTPLLRLQILDTEGVNWIDLAQDRVVAAFIFEQAVKFRVQ